jgi:hypothetical protein
MLQQLEHLLRPLPAQRHLFMKGAGGVNACADRYANLKAAL